MDEEKIQENSEVTEEVKSGKKGKTSKAKFDESPRTIEIVQKEWEAACELKRKLSAELNHLKAGV